MTYDKIYIGQAAAPPGAKGKYKWPILCGIACLFLYLTVLASCDASAAECTPSTALIDKVETWRGEQASTSDHYKRWDRVLAAFGESEAANPMTSGEADGYAARGWNRWIAVADELERLEDCGFDPQAEPEPEPEPEPQECVSASVRSDVEAWARETQHGQAHVDRWMRVLAAFGDDNGYTAMAVSEAEKMKEKYRPSRWNPVIAELERCGEPEPAPTEILQALAAADSVETAIANLPHIYHVNNVLIFSSEAPGAEHVSHDTPRVMAFGHDAALLLAWQTNPSHPDYDAIEFLEQSGSTWQAGIIDYSDGVVSHPTSCASCHGPQNKPLWGVHGRYIGTEEDFNSDNPNADQGATQQALDALAAAHDSTDARLTPLQLAHHQIPYEAHSARRAKDGAGVATSAGQMMMWRHHEVLYEHYKAQGQEAEVQSTGAFCNGRWTEPPVPLHGLSRRQWQTPIVLARFADGSLMRGINPDHAGMQIGYLGVGFSWHLLTLGKLYDQHASVRTALNTAIEPPASRLVTNPALRGKGKFKPADEMRYIHDRSFGKGQAFTDLRGYQSYSWLRSHSAVLEQMVEDAFNAAGMCACEQLGSSRYNCTFTP